MIYIGIVLYLFAGYSLLHVLSDLSVAQSKQPARFRLIPSLVFVFLWPIAMAASEIHSLIKKDA